ncbi:MAG: DUF3997 domain-containing protein [Planctomycetes bacterium]|nr:DUF3997 domain-containing protein [Planctomycetota bacterium]
MKEKLYYFLSFFAVAIFVGGCCFFHLPAYKEDLGNGYIVYAADVMRDVSISRKDPKRSSSWGIQVIPPTVFAYGWNDNFILAKRHPKKKDRKVDTSVAYWYIIEVTSGDVHGPLNEDEFHKLRTEFKVPEEISFKTIQ